MAWLGPRGLDERVDTNPWGVALFRSPGEDDALRGPPPHSLHAELCEDGIVAVVPRWCAVPCHFGDNDPRHGEERRGVLPRDIWASNTPVPDRTGRRQQTAYGSVGNETLGGCLFARGWLPSTGQDAASCTCANWPTERRIQETSDTHH